MSFISLCSAEIRFVTSLTSSSPKPFHLWEEKSWLQPFTDDWQLLQLSQAGFNTEARPDHAVLSSEVLRAVAPAVSP